MKFNATPVRAMSTMRNRCVPKTIAFGGVATGNMNAHDAVIVTGIMRNSGLRPSAVDMAAMMGSITCVVAVFDVNSVRNVINVQIARSSSTGMNVLQYHELLAEKLGQS